MHSIKTILRTISYWPPFLAAGIKVSSYDLEKGTIEACLRRTPLNPNAFGTHFGGSLFSMCDPWYVFLALHYLGKNYIVWDKDAQIEFIKATKEPVFATFQITKEEIKNMQEQAESGKPIYPKFETKVKTKGGTVIAEVKKTIYVRKKKSSFESS